MDEQLSQVFIASLADPGKTRSSTGRELLRNQTKPGCEIASLSETLGLADGRDQRRSDRHAYAGNRDQKPSCFVCLYEGCELFVEFLYAEIEFIPFSSHVTDQFCHAWT